MNGALTACLGPTPDCAFCVGGKCSRQKGLAPTCGWTDQGLCPDYEPCVVRMVGNRPIGSGATTLSAPEPVEPMKLDAPVLREPVESLEENVNHPRRYTKGKIECIDALEAAVVGKSPTEAIYVANIIKYLWRYEEKEPLRSLLSAQWYLDRLIEKIREKEVIQ